MSKIRIYDLAKDLGMAPKELADKIKEMGYAIRSHSSTLSEEEVKEIKNRLKEISSSKDEKKETHLSKKRGVIIRRAKSKEKEEATQKPVKPKIKIKLVIKKKSEKKEKEPPSHAEKKLDKKEFPQDKEKTKETIKEDVKKKDFTEKKKPPLRGPKVVARAVGIAKDLIKKETKKKEVKKPVKKVEDKVEKIEKTEKDKKKKPRIEHPKRVVTDFKKAKTTPPPEKPPEKKKKSKKKQVVELEDFRKKKVSKKRIPKPKVKREEILEELELMKELEEVSEGMELPEEPKEEEEKISEKKASSRPSTLPRKEKKIKIYQTIQVGELAKLMGVKAADIIKKFMELGTMVTITQSIDAETAAIVAAEFGYEIEQAPIEEEQLLEYIPPSPEELQPRPPVVTVMGHVDHGKTTLLDAIRKTNVAHREAGGITQHIGAYKVRLEDGQEITFIDTPGHEAFTSMRARGAQVTDIVILVVAADDGVMDQTREAIDHAKAADVPVVVAINKIDKPEANPDRVKTELAELGLVPEEWGGETLYAEISAKKRQGIRELLELVLLQAEMLELKAAPKRPARGRIIESRLDKGRGAVATLIVQEGTLRPGDPFVAGNTHGRVRAMFDEYGRQVKEAGPSSPVEVLGFSEVPQAGDDFIVMPDEQKARKVAEYRARKQREAEAAKAAKMSLEKLFEKLKEGEIKELKVILKADVQGTLEALNDSLQKLSTESVRVKIIRTGIGAISESDVMLAAASEAIIIGFNVRPTSKAKQLAQEEKVEIRFYDVIYKVIEEIKKAMSGLLEPEYEEKILGLAEVRATFKVPKVGVVAGCYVKEGKIIRGAKVRLLRDNVVVYTGKISSLKRFKEDVKEVLAGYECGVGLEKFNDIKEGDLIEAYEIIEIKREL